MENKQNLTFYFAPFSTANVTAAVLSELEHYQGCSLANRVQMSLRDGDQRKEEYLSINPNGLVPAIVHDGVAIWESAAITIYLGEMFGVSRSQDASDLTAALYPPPGPTRGNALKWIVWANTQFFANCNALRVAKGSHNTEAEKTASDAVMANLKILNSQLQDNQYLLGDWYSLADTHVWCFVSWLTTMGINLSSVPNVDRWVKDVGDRKQLAEDD